jgi:hypothetical protein
MFMRVNSTCAHQVRPPLGRITGGLQQLGVRLLWCSNRSGERGDSAVVYEVDIRAPAVVNGSHARARTSHRSRKLSDPTRPIRRYGTSDRLC